MQQILLATAMIFIALMLECRPVSLSPLSAPPKQSVEKKPPNDRREGPGGQPQSSVVQPASNPSQFHQPMPATGMSSPSRPSSQMFDTRHSMQPKDSYAGANSNGSPHRQDFNFSNLGETVRRQNHNYSQTNLSHVRPDSMIEGSGIGPSWTNGQNPKSKMDDTEDSGDDDEDKDDDYDYGDTLENGSGHGHLASTTQTPSSIGRIQSNEFHDPFRRPISMTDSKQIVSTLSSTKLIITTRTPASVSPTAAMSIVPSSTTLTPTSTPRQTTTPSRNLVMNNKNKTRGEVDYDYEDGGEDDDSEDSSIFEDNEPPEVGASKSNSTLQSNSTSNPGQTKSDIFEAKKRYNTTKLPSYTLSSSNQNPQFSPSTEISTIPTKYYTTPAPVTSQMMTKPAIAKPTAPQMFKPNSIPSAEGDQNSEDDKQASEDDEDDDDEQEDDDQRDDMEEDTQDDDEPHKASRPPGGSPNANKHHIKPNRPPRPIGSLENLTNQTISPSSRPKVSSSQEKHDKFTEFQTPTTTKPNVIIPSTPTTHLPVPTTPITTTTITSTTSKFQVVNTTPKPTAPSEAPTLKTNSFAQPVRSSTTPSSTTFRPASNFGADKSATRFTTSTNMQPGNNRSPQSKATASITQYENSDTLTRQVYEKAVEVYQEADRTVRAAWQAVWPSDINLDSSVVEPLLNQPMFFMLALGGTVICFVLLFLLVVYIITYQIQPKDDDSSIY